MEEEEDTLAEQLRWGHYRQFQLRVQAFQNRVFRTLTWIWWLEIFYFLPFFGLLLWLWVYFQFRVWQDAYEHIYEEPLEDVKALPVLIGLLGIRDAFLGLWWGSGYDWLALVVGVFSLAGFLASLVAGHGLLMTAWRQARDRQYRDAIRLLGWGLVFLSLHLVVTGIMLHRLPEANVTALLVLIGMVGVVAVAVHGANTIRRGGSQSPVGIFEHPEDYQLPKDFYPESPA